MAVGDPFMESTPDHFMEAAFDQAEEALQQGEVPIGCVFTKENKIICRGRNRVNETKDATRHAELVAVDSLRSQLRCCVGGCGVCEGKVRETLRGATLYVTCEPCIMCSAALRLLSISHVVFGCGNDRFGGAGSVLAGHNGYSDVLQPYSVERGVQEARAMEMLVRFYKQENKNAPETKRKCKT